MRCNRLVGLFSLFLLCGATTVARSQPTLPDPTGSATTPLSVAQQPTTPPGGQPTTPPAGTPGAQARPVPTDGPTAAAPSATQPQDLTQLSSLPESIPPEMLGDLIGAPKIRFFRVPGQMGQNQFVPIVVPGGRSFKLAENESPRPMDRVYFTYNYYDEVFAATNLEAGGAFRNIRLHRSAVGIEKSFCDGLVSLGIRQPFSTLDRDVSTDSAFDLPPFLLAPLAGSESELGDLSLMLKVAPYINPQTGDTLSFGLAVTFPTGESDDPLHATSLQPFVGYILNFGDWFVQGFTAVDIPTESADATYLYNDIGLGYFLFRNPDPCACLTAVVPTIECHISTPLSDRGGLERIASPPFVTLGNSDVVDLTFGVNTVLWRSLRLATGVVVPVTGPKPFDVEAMVQASWRF